MPFVKGDPNINRKGRAKLTTEQKRVKALTARLKSKDFLEIVDRVIVMAKHGEKWAVELLFKYQIGLPKQVIDMEHDGEIRFIVDYADGLSDNTTETP